MKRLTSFLAAVILFTASASTVHADDSVVIGAHTGSFSTEEQALLDKGATMEMYRPKEHSGHVILGIQAEGKATVTKVLCFVFGIEDATPARAEGKSMAEARYTLAQAEQFLFAQATEKYGAHDRFFVRAYVQEGEAAFNAARKSK